MPNRSTPPLDEEGLEAAVGSLPGWNPEAIAYDCITAYLQALAEKDRVVVVLGREEAHAAKAEIESSALHSTDEETSMMRYDEKCATCRALKALSQALRDGAPGG